MEIIPKSLKIKYWGKSKHISIFDRWRKDEVDYMLDINPIKTKETTNMGFLGLTPGKCLTFKGHIVNLFRAADYKQALQSIRKF